jgi:putative ABC transport system substrate-binding protein
MATQGQCRIKRRLAANLVAGMRRREFIALVGGAAVAWPLTARAQQPPMPVIGFLGSESAQLWSERLHAFRQCLSETGYIENQTVTIESASKM